MAVAPQLNNDGGYPAGVGNAYDSNEFAEGDSARLVLMDEFLATRTEQYLLPAFQHVRSSHTALGRPMQPVALLDVGAANSPSTEALCEQHDVAYHAADANQHLLSKRRTDQSRIFVGDVGELDKITQGRTFGITHSRAVVGWNGDRAQQIIEQQIGATEAGGVAVFSEFNWADARPGQGNTDEVNDAVMIVKLAITRALKAQNFDPQYGAKLGADIDAVLGDLASQGGHYQRMEMAHAVPEGDYRDLLLETARFIHKNLQKAAQTNPSVSFLYYSLGESIGIIEQAERCSIYLPTLVTQVVCVNRQPKAASALGRTATTSM